jgi:hypothetical protein
VIIISSPLNKTTSVSFKLTNKVKSYSKFTAGFSAESDPEFSVMPKQFEKKKNVNINYF